MKTATPIKLPSAFSYSAPGCWLFTLPSTPRSRTTSPTGRFASLEGRTCSSNWEPKNTSLCCGKTVDPKNIQKTQWGPHWAGSLCPTKATGQPTDLDHPKFGPTYQNFKQLTGGSLVVLLLHGAMDEKVHVRYYYRPLFKKYKSPHSGEAEERNSTQESQLIHVGIEELLGVESDVDLMIEVLGTFLGSQ